jgi:trimethylamine--corrinoid protein Co-methyltransferase
LLSDRDLEQIHDTSMSLLGNVGIEFPYDEALSVFRKHGVRTDGSRVFLSEDRVMSGLATVPSQFTIRARNPERAVTIGSGVPVFAPGYGAPFLVDLHAGKRTPSIQDYDNLVKLTHQLPNQDLSGHLLVQPADVPACSAHLHMLLSHILHSDKAFIGSSAGRAASRHTMEMACILFGGDISDSPVTIGLINSLSPLGYSSQMLGALLEYVSWRQPVMISSLTMAGSTGPISLAGVLATQNAELLAGIVLTQLASPGTPVVFGSTSTNIDMRSGALSVGSPEFSQMIAAHAQLARSYGLPSRSGGALTDSSYPDAQAAFESMLSLTVTVQSDIDMVLHAGGILSSYLAFSYEKLVLDDEMCGMLRRLRRGIDVSPATLAYDVVAKVGPGGNFLMEEHTVERCRTEFWQPAIADRGGIEAWMEGGRIDAAARARQRWQLLVAGHEDPPLEQTTALQLQSYVNAQIC